MGRNRVNAQYFFFLIARTLDWGPNQSLNTGDGQGRIDSWPSIGQIIFRVGSWLPAEGVIALQDWGLSKTGDVINGNYSADFR